MKWKIKGNASKPFSCFIKIFTKPFVEMDVAKIRSATREIVQRFIKLI